MNNEYPKTALVNNRKYNINIDFKVALRCIDIAEDSNISDSERALAIIYLLFGDDGLNNANDWDKLLKVGLKFLRCGQEQNNNDKSEEKNMDFNQDWGYIRTSFFYDYKLDLDTTNMHWWSFYEKTCGLSEKCILNRVRFVRDFDISKIKDRKEREKWIEQKKAVELKEVRKEVKKTSEQERLDKLFEKQLKKGGQ